MEISPWQGSHCPSIYTPSLVLPANPSLTFNTSDGKHPLLRLFVMLLSNPCPESDTHRYALPSSQRSASSVIVPP